MLSRLSFGPAGSLFEEKEEFYVKTCLSRGLLLNQRYAIEDIPRRPFKSERDYYSAHLSAHFEQAEYFPLGHHCFLAPIPARSEYNNNAEFRKALDWWSDFVTVESKIGSSENRVNYVTAGEVLSDKMTNRIDDFSNGLANASEPRFAIHHPDLSVNNIFVDEESNISCIIDWAFCSIVPLSTLLTAPGLPQSRYELDVPLSSMFELGFQHGLKENTAPHDFGTSSDLCKVLSRSRLMWLFSRILTFDSIADFHLFQAIWDLLGNSN